ncbi:type II toxin-antitoxin system MqsR family toxin [Escherichia coli]
MGFKDSFTEKRTPHTRLFIVKELVRAGKVSATRTSQEDAVEQLEFIPPPLPEMINVILALAESHFVKSMTAYADNTRWMDVYKTQYNGFSVYLKFEVLELESISEPGKVVKDRVLIVSFKEASK